MATIQSIENPDFFKEALKILQKLPPPKLKPIEENLDQTCVCGKQIHIMNLESLNTGVFVTANDVCKNCKEGHQVDQKFARIVCAKCKKVFCRIRPGTDKTGFTFVAGRSYHVQDCPQCRMHSDKKSFKIIEKALWDRTHGISEAQTLHLDR